MLEIAGKRASLGDLTRRLAITSQDELGDLAGAFNRFVEKIHGLVRQITEMTAQLTGLVGQRLAPWPLLATLPLPLTLPNYRLYACWHKRSESDEAVAWLRARVQGDLQTKGNNYVEGPLCAGKRLHLGPDSQVGDKDCPSSVSAWTIALNASVRVYGSIAAVRSGQVVL